MNSREYSRWRHSRRAAWDEADRKRAHPDIEAERLIEFACKWAPYGGASAEEILVTFGMTRPRFIERLWQVIPKSNCAQDQIHNLARVYPPHLGIPYPVLNRGRQRGQRLGGRQYSPEGFGQGTGAAVPLDDYGFGSDYR